MLLLFVQPLSFEIRPHVLSWIYLNLTLFSLEIYKRGNKKSLFALPFIMLFWVNSHSLSILGLIVIAIYNMGNFFESNKIDKRLLMFSFISLAAFVINPYLFEGLLFPVKQFGIIAGNNLFKSYIGELQSPFTSKEIRNLGLKYFINPLFLIHLSALLSLFSIIHSLKQKQFTDTLLLVAFLSLLHLGHKNYGYYFMVSLPLIIKYTLGWLVLRVESSRGKKLDIADNKKNKIVSSAPLPEVASFNQKPFQKFSFATIVLAIFISVTSIN